MFTPDITVQLWSPLSRTNLKHSVNWVEGECGEKGYWSIVWDKMAKQLDQNRIKGPNSFSLATEGRRWRVQLLHSTFWSYLHYGVMGNSMDLFQSYMSVSKKEEIRASLWAGLVIMMKLEEENSAGVGLFSVYFSIFVLNTVICHRLYAPPSNGN